MLASLLVIVLRDSRAAPAPMASGGAVRLGQGAPPDISRMTPRERFNRRYNRVMQAAQTGDEATVTRFTPMALTAYQMLDTVDADARYHAALLRVHTGDVASSRALGDTILIQNPGHLLGYVVLGTSARSWPATIPRCGPSARNTPSTGGRSRNSVAPPRAPGPVPQAGLELPGAGAKIPTPGPVPVWSAL